MALTNIASVDAASEEDSVRKVVADFGDAWNKLDKLKNPITLEKSASRQEIKH